MHNNEINPPNDPSAPTSSALTLRAAKKGASRRHKVLFIAASALGVASMPGVADQLLGSLGSTVIGTAHAGENNECNPAILPKYEQGVIAFLQEHVDLPSGIENFVSLFELSEAYDATILRDRQITILISGEGEVIPAPEGYYVFPDGLIAEIGEGGLIGPTWGEEWCDDEGGPWAMCQPTPGNWVDC